ncbi:hypothetical protein [Thalassobacillus sp. C254]|uniref:hypothetical protein n=1 Tax=Thalassobacillus sp. C254 TaxID=1225341 RepID=UPI0006CF472E|nr:hypothetical protein [Thalassobacillus sp. C254]
MEVKLKFQPGDRVISNHLNQKGTVLIGKVEAYYRFGKLVITQSYFVKFSATNTKWFDEEALRTGLELDDEELIHEILLDAHLKHRQWKVVQGLLKEKGEDDNEIHEVS